MRKTGRSAGAITLEGADQDATLAVTLVGPATFQGGPTTASRWAAGAAQSATVSGTGDVLGVLSVAIAARGRCDVDV